MGGFESEIVCWIFVRPLHIRFIIKDVKQLDICVNKVSQQSENVTSENWERESKQRAREGNGGWGRSCRNWCKFGGVKATPLGFERVCKRSPVI